MLQLMKDLLNLIETSNNQINQLTEITKLTNARIDELEVKIDQLSNSPSKRR